MSISNNESVFNKVAQNLEEYFVVYKQYLHKGLCKTGPCGDEEILDDLCCAPFVYCIHASNNLQKVPKHTFCDCYYQDLAKKALGTISERKPSPDVWLKLFGKLPNYYITKEEAREIYGWNPRRNTMAGKATDKMIGNEPYRNENHRLPEKEGRIWYECDVDYQSGTRTTNPKRLFYSNDGLMFYSTDHGKTEFYWIK